MADQQFCLRWNNHQSTLVSVFDSLLEKGTLVDCTLAAEGNYMKAHKVVLTACSPYFEMLLSEHYDKHPIVVLKDVKFYELKAIMDYMYKGEVNISQDQLASLLKVAESLQIKGLSDSGGGNEKDSSDRKHEQKKQAPPPRTAPSHPIENKRAAIVHSTPVSESPPPPVTPKPINSRDECASPIGRKRKKRRHSSSDDTSISNAHDDYDASNSSELPSQSPAVPNMTTFPSTLTPVPVPSKPATPITPNIETKKEPEIRPSPRPSRPPSQVSQNYATPSKPAPPAVPIETDVKLETTSEVLIEPKAEVVEENEDIEDLTLDDDEEDMYDHSQPGPSHGGDGSDQGYAPWEMADQSRDEVFLAAQEAAGGPRDSQDFTSSKTCNGKPSIIEALALGTQKNTTTFSQLVATDIPKYVCPNCFRTYQHRNTLARHITYECGKHPMFDCPHCPHKSKLKSNLKQHILLRHRINNPMIQSFK